MENKSNLTRLIISAAVALGLIAVVLVFSSNVAKRETASLVDLSGVKQQLKIDDIVIGTGAEALPGTAVTVHYTGILENGTKFDSSIDNGVPFQFPMGFGHVIPCWDIGLQGKKVGAKLRLTCPPDMAYGETGAGGIIPPNATLFFDVEILNVEGEATLESPEQQ